MDDATTRIETVESFNVVGLELVCDPDGNYDIPGLWDKLSKRYEEIENRIDFYGICLPREDSKPGFRYIASVKVLGEPKAPDGMVAAEVPAAKYAVYPFKDKVAAMPARFNEIYGKLLGEAGLKPHPSFQCMEYYPHDCYDEATGIITADLYVVIE